jgi:putative hydrolase of the HAD superfamily
MDATEKAEAGAAPTPSVDAPGIESTGEPPREPARPTSAEQTILARLKHWAPTTVDKLLPLGRESLETVTALTEYEDGKAGRVLTAIALLSAAAGTIYAAMLKELVPVLPWWDGVIFNGLFLGYAGINGIGVVLLVRAIYPWFNIPSYWRKKKERSSGRPKSMIFGPLIAAVTPEAWADAFKEQPASDLEVCYLKNYIHESYLIAEKILRKYKRLRNALWFVAIGNALLLPIWVGYTVYLNMQRGTQAGTPMQEVQDAASDTSEYTCFIVIDADNTLWDTNRLFVEAQLGMLNDIRSWMGMTGNLTDPLKFVRDVDQSIAAKHPAGLKYPPELLVDGIIKALGNTGKVKKLRNRQALNKKLAATYLSKIHEIPKLRVGVQEGLRDLRKLGARTVICSEGVNESLLRNLNELGVLGYVEKVIVAPKSPEVFRRLSEDYNPNRKVQLSVGDQLDRDIQFAKTAGYTTVYFPGDFQPNWLPPTDTVRPDLTINSLAVLPQKVKVLIAPNVTTKTGLKVK